jgi:hypothetical protein
MISAFIDNASEVTFCSLVTSPLSLPFKSTMLGQAVSLSLAPISWPVRLGQPYWHSCRVHPSFRPPPISSCLHITVLSLRMSVSPIGLFERRDVISFEFAYRYGSQSDIESFKDAWTETKFFSIRSYSIVKIMIPFKDVRGCIQKFPDWVDNEI